MRLLIILTFILTSIANVNVSAYGRAIRIPTASERLAHADVVVRGRITRVEPKTVKLEISPGSGRMVECQVGLFKIDEAFQGVNGLTHLRVAYRPESTTRPGGYGLASLRAKTEVLLFLDQAPGKTFYQVRSFYDVVSSKHPSFKNELKEIGQTSALLEDRLKNLKGTDADKRALTASLLVLKYREMARPKVKEVPIDREESRLILRALLESDWKQKGRSYPLTPRYAFSILGINAKDGFNQPKNYRELETVAKKWLKENLDKYVIKRRVPVERKKK